MELLRRIWHQQEQLGALQMDGDENLRVSHPSCNHSVLRRSIDWYHSQVLLVWVGVIFYDYLDVQSSMLNTQSSVLDDSRLPRLSLDCIDASRRRQPHGYTLKLEVYVPLFGQSQPDIFSSPSSSSSSSHQGQ